MKPLVIYHANCADGFGAAFAAWLKLGDEAEYLPMQYGKIPNAPCGVEEDTDSPFYVLADGSFDSELPILNREIYILDFSFPRWVMDGLFNWTKRVVWLDHHKTAFEMWCPNGERNLFQASNQHKSDPWRHCILLDNDRSGAMLAWEYFHSGTEVPMLIRHIDDYDRWVFALEDTKAFNKALWSYAPWSFEQWKNMVVPGTWHGEMVREGEAILRAHEQNVAAVVKSVSMGCEITLSTGTPTDPLGYEQRTGLAANCPPHLTSDVGHALATQSGTFGLCWCFNKDGLVICSLRSNGDYDVSAIAKAFGGGGHRNAAGFQIDLPTLMGWLG